MNDADVRLTARAAARAVTVFTQLERANYIVKDDSVIETLALAYVDARLRVNRTSSTYLRVLCANAQAILASAPGHDKALSVTDGDVQRRVLAQVHRRYYPIILATVTTPDIAKAPNCKPDERRRRAKERNRRSNFARTSYSMLRRFVREGHDLMELRVDRLTKRALTDGLPAMAPTSQGLAGVRGKRVLAAFERRADGLAKLAERAIKADERAALPQLEKLAQRLWTVLARHTLIDATPSKADAIEQGKPWLSGDTVFLPAPRGKAGGQ